MALAQERPVIVLTDANYSDGALEAKILAEVGAELLVRHSPSEDELIRAASDAIGVLVTYTPISGRAIAELPNLRIISRCGSGVDNIDTKAAASRGVRVTNVPGYCRDEVADQAITLLLASERRLLSAVDRTRGGTWPSPRDLGPIRGLRGATLGLIGFGQIARAVATRAIAFGMEVCAYDPMIDASTVSIDGRAVDLLDLDALLAMADYVSIHTPLTEATRHLIGERALRLMKPTATLINTSRGATVDTRALLIAVRSSWIAGAALDVLENEPDGLGELANLPNVVVTPHMAWYSEQSIEELRRRSAEEIARYLRGEDLANPVV